MVYRYGTIIKLLNIERARKKCNEGCECWQHYDEILVAAWYVKYRWPFLYCHMLTTWMLLHFLSVCDYLLSMWKLNFLKPFARHHLVVSKQHPLPGLFTGRSILWQWIDMNWCRLFFYFLSLFCNIANSSSVSWYSCEVGEPGTFVCCLCKKWLNQNAINNMDSISAIWDLS